MPVDTLLIYSSYLAIPDLKSSSEPLQASVPSPSPLSDRVSPGSDGMLHPKSGLQHYHPLPSPSASSSKVIIDAGSVSDSGVTSRAARSSRYLDVSFAHKGGVSLQDLRHRSPSSPCLSLPGYLSDGCTFDRSLHASRLDVKRLLSKPAALSAVSTVSISSDPGSHAVPRSALNSGEAWPSRARMQTSSPGSITGSPTISGSDPCADQSPTPSPPSSQQRPRNVLRKKSSSGPSQARAITSATVPSDKSISSPPQSSTHPPDAVPSRSQRSITLQSLIRSRAAVPASAPPSGSGRLTPAGAIIQAYKEQDNRREALAAAASVEKRSPIIPISASWVDTSEKHASGKNAAPSAENAPFHIELSRSPDSFVMVDNPSDPVYRARSASPNAGQPIKSLTRKVSARFRRGLAAVSGTGAQSGREHEDGEGEQMNRHRSNTDGRDRRERQLSLDPHNAKHKPESLSLSIDSPPPSTPSSGLMDPWDERLGRTPQVESAQSSPNTFTQSKGKETMQAKVETSSSTSTRLWRLVKRISTGALRERSQMASEAPPPVPAVPKQLPHLPPRTTFEVRMPSGSSSGVEGGPGDDSDGGKGVMNCHIDSNLSASGVASQGDGYSSTAACVLPGTHASPRGHSVSGHPRRPSLSSSPQSSEPTSTRFFRSHSSRSSFSSIIGNSPPPPVPIHPLARSPSPRTHSPTKNSPSLSTRATSHDEPPKSPRTRSRGRSSPEIPALSVSGVVNNFILRRPSLARHQRHHAPTRSMIFPRTTPDISAAQLRRTGSEVRRPMRERPRVDPISMPGSSGQNRDSRGSDTTVRRVSASAGAPSARANAGSSDERLTFRELGSERKQALTSQEKEDKWHALLERSARAGGTLHLGAGGARLASDNIRFSSSTYSSSSESEASLVG